MKLEVRYQRSEGRKPLLPVFRFSGLVCCLLISVLCVLAGCATAPKSVPPPPLVIPPQAAPVIAPKTKPSAPPPKPSPAPPVPPKVAAPPASASAPAPVKDELVVSIDSEPAGAIIVVNDIPIGKAPLRLEVKATPQGFFRDYLTVKARFLATSPAETSRTVEEDCTPLEKIPGGIMFTPQKAQRRL